MSTFARGGHIVSIAALGSTWLLSLAANALTGAATNKATSSQSTGNTETSASTTANFGDAFQLSLSSVMMSTPQPPNGIGGIKDDIGDFLSKVASGTVTSSDLQQMREKLQQAAQNGGVQGHHHHRRHHGGEDGNQDNQMAASGVGADLRAFLEKLVKGTATDEDFKNIEAEISAINSTSQTTAANSSTLSSASEILRVSGISKALLNSALDAYNNQAYYGSPRA